MICASVEDRILSPDEAAALDMDAYLVLGARVWDNGKPSGILEDRLITGIAAYEAGVSDRLLMSGDHGQEDYDEVNAMKTYAIDAGIPSEDIFMDHAGFSTYESLYRARDVFQVRSVVIVTQRYHLYRALYIAERMGLTAYGIAADIRSYPGMPRFEARELLARLKDFFYTLSCRCRRISAPSSPLQATETRRMVRFRSITAMRCKKTPLLHRNAKSGVFVYF